MPVLPKEKVCHFMEREIIMECSPQCIDCRDSGAKETSIIVKNAYQLGTSVIATVPTIEKPGCSLIRVAVDIREDRDPSKLFIISVAAICQKDGFTAAIPMCKVLMHWADEYVFEE